MKLKISIVLLFLSLSALFINMTGAHEALLHDAATYYEAGMNIGSMTPFIDHGYPIFLNLISKLLGSNILFMQIANYIMWGLTTYLITQSFHKLKFKHTRITSILMLFSPLFLTFSAKLYSEGLAALGVAMIILGTITSPLWIFTGIVVLITTKSIFFPIIIFYLIWQIVRRNTKSVVATLLAIILVIPGFITSLGGGRSLYNLSIESAKIEGTYADILSCTPYYISYPLGIAIVPQYEGVCHQNDPNATMPGYARNPYVLAVNMRENGFSYQDWALRIISNPFKAILVWIVSLTNFVLVEGIYPSIMLQLPQIVQYPLFILTRVVLSAYLWNTALKGAKSNRLLIAPLIIFFILIGQYQVEPRYIYPLLPYLYFLSGLSHNQKYESN